MNRIKQFILEMAISRSDALKKIDEQAIPLLNHLMCINAFQQWSDWDQTVVDISNRIIDILDSCNPKIKKGISLDILMDVLYHRYVDDVDLDNKIRKLAKLKSLKVVENDMSVLHSQYQSLISLILKDEYLTREDVKDLVGDL